MPAATKDIDVEMTDGNREGELMNEYFGKHRDLGDQVTQGSPGGKSQKDVVMINSSEEGEETEGNVDIYSASPKKKVVESEVGEVNGGEGEEETRDRIVVENGHSTPATATVEIQQGEASTINATPNHEQTPRQSLANSPTSITKVGSRSPEKLRQSAPTSPHVQRISMPSSTHKIKTKSSKSAPDRTVSIKVSTEISQLKAILSETSPQAIQAVFKDDWRKLLYDNHSEDHSAFVLRCLIKNAHKFPKSVEILTKDKVTVDSILELPGIPIRILKNATPFQILKHVPTEVVDQALAERLKDVDALSLVRWLGEANRLGFKPDDILDTEDEMVTPLQVESPPPPQYSRAAAPYQQKDPLLLEQERNLAMANNARYQQQQQAAASAASHGQIGPCPSCGNRFPTMSGYDYHVTKMPCRKAVPEKGHRVYCLNCMSGFTNDTGLKYHTMKGVCQPPPSTNGTNSPNHVQQAASAQSHAQPDYSAYQSTNPVNNPARPPMHSTQPASSIAVAIPAGPPSLSRPPMESAPPARASRVSTGQMPEPASNRSAYRASTGSAPFPAPVPSSVRRHPSELSPGELAALNAELEAAQARYDANVADIEQNCTGDERAQKLTTATNGINTRLSNIRKKHGVSLRMRKADKDLRAAAGVTPLKRQRRDQAESSENTPASGAAQAPPASGFSPVNGRSGTNTPSSAPPPYQHPHGLPQQTLHAKSPLPHPSPPSYPHPNHNPSAYHGPSQRNPPPSANASQFGVMRMVPTMSSTPPNSYNTPYSSAPPHAQQYYTHQPTQNSNPHKRRRSSTNNHSSPRPTAPVPPVAPSRYQPHPTSHSQPQPWFVNQSQGGTTASHGQQGQGLTMMPVKSYDAKSKLAGHYNKSGGRKSRGSSSGMSVVESPVVANGGGGGKGKQAKGEVIVLDDTDDESESAVGAQVEAEASMARREEEGEGDEVLKSVEGEEDRGEDEDEEMGDGDAGSGTGSGDADTDA